MKTKEIDIKYEGKPAKVVIKRMGWEEKNEFLEQFVEYKTIGNTQVVIPHPFKIRAGAIRKCVVSAPFKTDPTHLNEIEDFDMLDKVWSEIEKFNEMDEDVKKNSNSPSETEQATPKLKK